jgi:lipopolysaccharide assembly outer membrane protein LptD (OstA)
LIRSKYILIIIVFISLSLRAFSQKEIPLSDTTTINTDQTVLSEKRDSIEPRKPIFESPIDYKSRDSMAVSFENGQQIVYLYGDANVKYGTIELTADFISVNFATKEIYAEGIADTTGTVNGKPHFKESSEEFDCSSLRYNFVTSKGFVENVVTDQQDGKVHGAKAKMMSKDVFCLVDGKYSTCDAEHPHFYLEITKGKIINQKAIIAGLSYIVIEDFPIYFPFLPYGYIPTNKTTYSSGIIVPSYGQLDNRGYYLKDGGFYWAASDYFDLKITSDIYSKGGWALNFASSYRKKYKFSGNFSLSYSKTVTGEKGINQTVSPSFSVQWSHSQDTKANPSSSFSASVNYSSSGYNKNNEYDNSSVYLNSSQSSSISFRKNFLGTPFSMTANIRETMNLKDSTLSFSLPEMTLNMKSIQPFKRKNAVGSKRIYEDFAISYSTSIKNTIKTKESEILSTPFSEWEKSINNSFGITLMTIKFLDYINITPSVSFDDDFYLKYYEKYWTDGYLVKDYETNLNKWIPGHVVTKYKDGFKQNYNYNFGISASTTLYGMFQIKNPNSKIKAIRHKIVPSLGFSYTPDFSKEKFGFYNMVQVDSLGNIQQYNIFTGSYSSTSKSGSINFGASNNIEMKVVNTDTTSTEKFKKIPIFDNLSFSGSYNLAADSMRLSTISLNARTKIAGQVINISGTLDPYALNEKGTKTKEYMWSEATGLAKLGRITNLSTGFNFSFSSDKLSKQIEKKTKKGEKEDDEKKKSEPIENNNYSLAKIPWNISMSYSLSYRNTNNVPKITQSLGFNGNIDFTDKWKATFTSGFDFETMKLTYTNMSVTRNLHCWTMSFNFTPIGTTKNYSFTLSANASMLKDIKINKSSADFPSY